MLALRKRGPGPGLSLETVDAPSTCGPHDVLISVHATGICGSDLHIDDWDETTFDWLRDKLPVTLGHEFSGTITALGANVQPDHPALTVGTRVTVQPALACGHCPACSARHPERCSSIGFIGVTTDGAFSPVVSAPATNCYVLPDDLGFSLAALCEPLCVSRNALVVGGMQPGATVLVLGPGTIGQGIAVQAKLAGASTVIVAGFDDTPRLQQCKALGVDHVIDLARDLLPEALHRFTGGHVDCAFEATGVPQSVSDGLNSLRVGGVLTCSGIHFDKATVDISTIVRRRLQIRGAYSSTAEDWPIVIDLLSRHSDRFAPMITHNVRLSDAPDGFALARSKSASKVMVYPGHVPLAMPARPTNPGVSSR